MQTLTWQGLGSDLCSSLYFYLTSCCVSGEHGCQGLWKFLDGLAESRWHLWFSFPSSCEQSPRLTGFVLGSLRNPLWYPKATTSHHPLTKVQAGRLSYLSFGGG